MVSLLLIHRELKPNRFEERAAPLFETIHLREVVLEHAVLQIDGIFHVFHVRSLRLLVNLVLEHIGLLRRCIVAVVVSREWVECANEVPSSAQFGRRVGVVAADVRASKRNAKDVAHHDVDD
jgi:hypothetical protein